MWRVLWALPLLLTGCGEDESASAPACETAFVVARLPGGDRSGYDIYSATPQLMPRERLTTNGQSTEPVVSFDGRRIAYVSGEDGDWDPELGSEQATIHVMDIDGSGDRRVSGGVSDRSPSWSPDGAQIAFEREGKVVVLSLEDRAERVLAEGSAPAWSPDGDFIAFVGHNDSDPPWSLRVIRSDGTEARSVHDWPDGAVRPIWSPDGTEIAFSEFDPEASEYSTHTVDVLSGQSNEVPGSRTGGLSMAVAWTDRDELMFLRQAPMAEAQVSDLEVVSSTGGTSEPRRLRTTEDGIYNLRASDNPACAP